MVDSVTFQVLQFYFFFKNIPSVTFEKQSVTFLALSVTIWLTVLLFKFFGVTFLCQVLLLKSAVLLFCAECYNMVDSVTF